MVVRNKGFHSGGLTVMMMTVVMCLTDAGLAVWRQVKTGTTGATICTDRV